jgi:hypothetical protein
MPISLANLAADTATARVDYGAAGDINIVFHPNRITEQTLAAYAIVRDKNNEDMVANVAALRALILDLAESWDLFGKDGQPVPLTNDGLRTVPIMVLADVMAAMFQGSRLGESNGTPSSQDSSAITSPASATSSRKRASKASRTGSRA